MQNGGTLDPLLYFSSSVFIIGTGLLGMRLVPLLIRLLFSAGKKFWPPSLYAAFLRVLRTKNSQSFIMIFLILTISLGIFNTTAARSINGNAEDRICYMDGADVVVQEAWESAGAAEIPDFAGTGSSTDYVEPNFEKYRQIQGVESLTKVYYSKKASVSSTDGNNIRNAVLMGIDTKEFGETANFKTSLMATHWYFYLNAMSQDPRGILVSSSFRDERGYSIGDVLSYSDSGGSTLHGVIYGFVDYWPTFAPRTVCLLYTSTAQTERGRFSVGDTVEINYDDTEHEAIVQETTETENKKVAVRFQLSVPDPSLSAGKQGTILLVTDTRENVLFLPLKAVISLQNAKLVYYVDEDGIKNSKVVTTGLEADGKVEILDGLEEGELVIQ